MTERDEFKMIPVFKMGVAMRISEEVIAMDGGFYQKGHREPVTPTPEQIAQHARAVQLVAELEENPYVSISGYDYEVTVEPLQTSRWVADETHEEWMARYRASREEPEHD